MKKIGFLSNTVMSSSLIFSFRQASKISQYHKPVHSIYSIAQTLTVQPCTSVRPLSCFTQVQCAGHAKWQNIKHIKAANDAEMMKRNHLMTNRIRLAIKQNGNVNDPTRNGALKKVIDEAKSKLVPNTTIDKAVKSSGDILNEIIWEIRGPGRVSIIAECLGKHNKAIAIWMNPLMKKYSSELGVGLMNMFQKKGIVIVQLKKGSSFDDAESDGIEVGAEEVTWASEESEGLIQYQTDPYYLSDAKSGLENLGYSIIDANVVYLPTVLVELTPLETGVFRKLLEALENTDCVTGVHHNAV